MTIIIKIHDCVTKDPEPPASPTNTEVAESKTTSVDTTTTESPGMSFILQRQRNVCERVQLLCTYYKIWSYFLVVSCEYL